MKDVMIRSVCALPLAVLILAVLADARGTSAKPSAMPWSLRGGDNGRKCLSAHTAADSTSTPSQLCFERISDIPATHFLSHPGTNSLAVVGTQAGKMSLIAVPRVGSGKAAKEVGTWLDLTTRVDSSNPETGLLSFAFHPNFVNNGRFFVSYICDARKVPDCKSWCACNSNTNCTLGALNATCDSTTIVEEYSAMPINGRYNLSLHLRPTRVKRLLAFGRPFVNHNGGHIFFGKDGYLYYTSGDGGAYGDPFNFAQSTNTFLGKILRIDVNGAHAPRRNYGVPKSNPFANRPGIRGEIYALGLRNPWRCDQDPVTGYIVCGDVGQDTVEEIDIIQAGHNYMWHNYEGTSPYKWAPRPAVYIQDSRMVGKKTGPIFEYLHSCSSQHPTVECVEPGYVSVTGGVVYRGAGRNKCLQGKYLYNDVSGPMWVGTIYPSSGQSRTTKRVKAVCTSNSPLPCLGDGMPAIGSIWAWGKDQYYNAYPLGNMGVFRLVNLNQCGIQC